MNRLQRFHSLESHPFLGKEFKRMTVSEKTFCINFIDQNENLNDDQFIEKANRVGLGGELAAFKNKTIIWGLLIQSIEPKVRKK